MSVAASVVLVGVSAVAAAASQPIPNRRSGPTKIAGFAFVDSSVTARGQSGARLPRGTKIYPSGGRITGRTGCPNRYQTKGLLIVVIDYSGPKTAGSVTVTRRPAGSRQSFADAPYYLDLNPGREIQYQGPIFANGSYSIAFQYGFAGRRRTTLAAKIVLARNCPSPG